MRSARTPRRATAPTAPAPANDTACGCSAEPGQAVVVCARHAVLTACSCDVRDGQVVCCEGHARQLYPDITVDAGGAR